MLKQCTTLLAAVTICATTAYAQSPYRFETIDVPGAPGTELRGINLFGQQVGTFGGLRPRDPTPLQGFVHSDVFVTIDVPGARNTTAYGINNLGTIVGRFDLHGYIRDKGGQFTTITEPPGTESLGATGINIIGDVVGGFTDRVNAHGFLLQAFGHFVQIDVPGAIFTEANAINDFGQIVGIYDSSTGGHAFFRSGDGAFTTIDVPGAGNTTALGINNLGQVVGTFNNFPLPDHGFLLSGGTVTVIDVPGAADTDAVGINDLGVIVGSYGDSNGNRHGFIATPIFAGLPGKPPCFGDSNAAMAHEFGGLGRAAAQFGFASIDELRKAMLIHCGSEVPALAKSKW